MKKQITAALVGGFILFLWQFISWAMLGIHEPSQLHSPNQEAILECLNQNLSEEGTYFMPRLALDAPSEDQEAFYQKQEGKPWAIVSYHKNMQNTMGMNLGRGFLIDFLSVFLLCWILMRMKDLDMKTILLTALAVGIIGYLTINYLNTIWFKNNSIPYLIDAVLSWGLVGIWLGWFLPRGNR
ncbi:MAG TPA: hypothetical protein ENJ45_00470 [Phaeodactylibacter sp.]|nr:hypothetical protein [Phaeodactylibacter sp.]